MCVSVCEHMWSKAIWITLCQSRSQACFWKGAQIGRSSGKCDSSCDESAWWSSSHFPDKYDLKRSRYVKFGLARFWQSPVKTGQIESSSYILSVSVNRRWYSMGPELSRRSFIFTWMLQSGPWPECSKWTGTLQIRKRCDFFFFLHVLNNGMQVQCMVHQHGVQQVHNYLSSGFWEVVRWNLW